MIKSFKKREYRRWTDPELECLKNRKIPAGRTYAQCCTKALALGIPYPESPTGRHKWSGPEIDTLRSGKVPAGRTASACITKGYCLGLRVIDLGGGKLQVEPLHGEKSARCDLMEQAAILSKMRSEGLTYAQIAEKVGLSKQHVCELVHKFRSTARYIKTSRRSYKRIELLAKQFAENRK